MNRTSVSPASTAISTKAPISPVSNPLTDAVTPLFHPRQQRWDDHFRWEGIHIVGQTEVGRTTIRVLSMNSSNSSKPPSSDGLKRKTKSMRRKNTGRKPGGQPGHTGQTLQQSPTPDITHPIPLDHCATCRTDLRDQPVASEEKRQVFDLPPIAMEVSEHRAECKWCPTCAKWVTATFPAEVIAPVQYGGGMQSLMSYLNVAQLLPCERVADVCQDIFNHRPSSGSVPVVF